MVNDNDLSTCSFDILVSNWSLNSFDVWDSQHYWVEHNNHHERVDSPSHLPMLDRVDLMVKQMKYLFESLNVFLITY